MPDDLANLFAAPAPSADRPLAGITLLLVEDSRFASEAVRLLCLRSGARIRRADSLATAERHLATYRPTVALIDLGLPDGSGLDLIARLSAATPRLAAILATSGDDGQRAAALAAGADGFIAKPCTALAEFQAAVLAALRPEAARPRLLPSGRVAPDPLAFREDLAAIGRRLNDSAVPADLSYAAHFLAGLARCAEDARLADAAARLGERLAHGRPTDEVVARLAGLVAARLHADASQRRIG